MPPTFMNCKRIVLAVLGVVALIATSCGGSTADVVDTAADTSTASAPVADTGGEDDTGSAAAPSLVASTVNGGQIDFGSLEGQDVVLWFWAPW